MRPPFQPLALAFLTHWPSAAGLMMPLEPSEPVAGLPMTILSRSTPAVEWIWKTAESGQALDEAVRRPELV